MKKSSIHHFNRKALANLMDQEGLTGTSLGEKLGMSGSSALNWLSGKGKPNKHTLVKLARALSTEPGQLSNDFAKTTARTGHATNGAISKELATAVESARAQCGRVLFDDITDQHDAIMLAQVLAHLNAAGRLLRTEDS